MRHIQGYTWKKLLDEPFIQTQVTFELLNKEKEEERKEMEKAKRRGRK